MPPPTDRSARRSHLAELAIRLIGTEGLQATTIRRLASEAGYSTAIVTHYFHNKQDLLFKVYDYVSVSALKRFDELMADPACSFQDVMEALLPIGEEERISWRVVFAFWQLALVDEEFGSRQRLAMDNTQVLIENLLVSYGYQGDARAMARTLLATIMGISVRAIFEGSWDDDYQRELLRRALADVALPGVA